MAQLMRMERKKLFQSKIFWIVLAIGMILVLWDIADLAIETGQEREIYEEWYNPELPASTLYNVWLGNEGYSFAFSVFYCLFPLICVLPYGWSLSLDMKSGYLKNIAVRTSRKKYFMAKYLTAFLGGALAGTIPLAVDFIGNAMFIPALKPDIIYPYYTMMEVDFLSDMYCVHPLLFNLIFFVFTFVYFGLIGGCAVCCAFLVKNRILSVLLPAGVLLFFHYISSLVSYSVCRFDLSPLYCIHPTVVRYHSSGWILFGYMGLFVIFSVLVIELKGNDRYEIY